MAGDAVDFRILDRIDHDVVADPVDADLADLVGGRGAGAQGKACGEYADQFSQGSLLGFVFADVRWDRTMAFASHSITTVRGQAARAVQSWHVIMVAATRHLCAGRAEPLVLLSKWARAWSGTPR
ncbi:hypothetical protein AU467_14295 [Mesorhizobium loti]|uniref:Uncharacterized protein n=1 Tax=Rhizobium loti TaxID=381 RepID=A0A101KW44_RHILI|nr:hypothetical protein AU467_14295 [Mesorhizobium loti]